MKFNINAPSSICLKTGEYILVNEVGNYRGSRQHIRRGELFPSTPSVGWGWVLQKQRIKAE
jgi:hypothetical protein